jgi:hypothetical protein
MKMESSYQGPMPEDDYLALVLRIQQAMAIEPFQPSVIDVVKLLSDWRDLSNGIERLRDGLVRAGRQLAATDEYWQAERDRLRAAAQAVIDSINDENEIDPDTIARLSRVLAS